ncbi:MAG: adenosylcobinamide-GDP ribazoletransferase [bacterium]
MKNIFRRFFLSLSFLTILPVNFLFLRKGQENWNDIKEDLSKSSIFFPLVGILIGLILIGVNSILQWISLNSFLSSGIILTVWIFLSGGLHLEGFADMVDGFSGGRNKEDIIRIMKDGAIGAKGAIALILLILLKFLLINSLPYSLRMEAFLIAPVMGRWSMVLSGYLGKPASSDNTLSKIFSLYLGKMELILATLFTLVIAFYFLSYQALYFMGFSAIISYLMVYYSFTKMQGICGDVIGAINEIAELSVLLIFLFY